MNNLGRIGKGVHCSIKGCDASAIRSLSSVQFQGGGLEASGGGGRVYLCEAHYKQWKKRTKKSRELDRIRFS